MKDVIAIGRFWSWVVGLWVGCGLLFSSFSQAAEQLAIAPIRHSPPEEIVTVQGIVTVPSGAFASGTGDRGFAIQDQTAGIYVSTQENLHLALNQHVEVTGIVHDDGHGLLVLAPSSAGEIIHLAKTTSLSPHPVPTGTIGETTEGELVTITGKIIEPLRRDPPYGVGIMLDDGSGPVQAFINQSTGINVPEFSVGQTLQVQGFSGQYEQFIEVSPRVKEDIVALD